MIENYSFSEFLINNYGNSCIEEAKIIFIGEEDHTDKYRSHIEALIINCLSKEKNNLIVEGHKEHLMPEDEDYQTDRLGRYLESGEGRSFKIIAPEEEEHFRVIYEILALQLDVYKESKELETTKEKLKRELEKRLAQKKVDQDKILEGARFLEEIEIDLERSEIRWKKLSVLAEKAVIEIRNDRLESLIQNTLQSSKDPSEERIFVIFGAAHYSEEFLEKFNSVSYRVLIPKVFQSQEGDGYGMKKLEEAAARAKQNTR